MGPLLKKYFNICFSDETTAQSGFTLMELLVTIGVISILAGGLLTIINPLGQQQKAYDAKRKSDLEQIQRALEQYYNDNNSYPGSITFGSAWVPYMQKIPQDPESGKTYIYQLSAQVANGQGYQLYASLDNQNDQQLCFSGGAKCTYAPGSKACGGVCNYGVSSPNASP